MNTTSLLSVRCRAIVLICALGLAMHLSAQQASPRVPGDPGDPRIQSLLSQMTLQEKIDLIRGQLEPQATNQGQAGYLSGVPRLGVPSLRMSDGPPGVLTRVPSQGLVATMGVAATWNRAIAQQNGDIIARQARALGIDVVLEPFINIDRDLAFSRGYNTFGEDPYLTGQMGAAEIRGTQAQGIMAQAKHFVGYDSDSFNVSIDPQTLHEVYVAPFADAVDAGVSSIMCSYNHINGPFACGNASTLDDILRNQLGFRGFVTSDWGAVHSVRFLGAGLDMEMPGDVNPASPFAFISHSFFLLDPPAATARPKMDPALLGAILGGALPEEPPPSMGFGSFPLDVDPISLRQAMTDGAVTEQRVTAAAARVLSQMARFGLLDGKQKHQVTPQDIASIARVIEQTAERGAVLLRNEANNLPLKPADLTSLAFIGPTAGQVDAIGQFGERSTGLPERQVSPLQAMRKLAPKAVIQFAVADDMTGVPVPASALSHDGKPGLQRSVDGNVSVDPSLNFTHGNHASLAANSTAKWSGDLTVAQPGTYWMYLQVSGARARLVIDGKDVSRSSATFGTVHGDVQHASQDNGMPTSDGLDNVRRSVLLEAGKHSIAVDIEPDTSNEPAQVRLNWMTPQARDDERSRAIQAARAAHTAVVFAWTRGNPAFGLPGDQDQLIADIAAVNPHTIVVLNTSQPVAMPWLDHVQGVLEMWWPGDEGGWATAKLLLGRANPSGHLPMTWGQRLQDYPATDPAHPERSTQGREGLTTFSEGLLVGYRWFDANRIVPLYPFGYGLSYTSFALSQPALAPRPDGGVDVTVHVRNTGAVAGSAVPQIYLDAPTQPVANIAFAPRTLAGFDNVDLKAGEERVVSIRIASRAFQYWSEADHAWKTAPGPRTLRVGSSSRDLPLALTTP